MAVPKLSIVVPAYNAIAYIDKCIHSLIAQSLQDIEIILVNDASTDDTLKLMRTYEAKHPDKIKIIDSPVNQRQGGARNLGIAAAKGEYIGFVDSDDWIEPEMFDLLYAKATAEQSDLAYCYRQQVLPDGSIEGDGATYFLPTGEVTEDKRREMLVRHITFVQRYIYKRELLTENNITYPTHLWYEDMAIDPLILMYVQKISAVKKPLYNYHIHPGSTITKKDNGKYRDRMKVSGIIVEELKKRNFYEQYKAEIDYLYFRKGYILSTLNYLINNNKPDRAVIRSIRQQMLELDEQYSKNAYYTSNKFFVLIDKWLQLPGQLPLLLLKNALRFKRLSI